MEHKELTSLVAIDLSAAFDTVDHSILLEVLSNRFGVCGTALKWLQTYLSPRNCKVNVGSEYSRKYDLTLSVPQGSCAGPFLFLAYASTLEEVIPSHIDLYGFADDHILKHSYSAGNREAELKTQMDLEQTIQDVNTWMTSNRLKMNNSKTEFIIFGSKKMLKTSKWDKLKVSGEIVTRSESVKYLGVNLDNELTFRKYIISKCQTAMLNILRIKTIRSFLTLEACKILMTALVLSHLDYANSVLIGLPHCAIR